MDRFLTRKDESVVVLSNPMVVAAAVTHKRSADADVNADHSDGNAKRAKTAAENNSCLPPFPSHACEWQPAAQSFHDSLPHSHRAPFVSLVNDILACYGTSPTSLSPPPTVAPSPPAASFDTSSALLTFNDLSFVQPRGKLDVHVTRDSLVLSSNGKQPSTTVVPFATLAELIAVPDINRKDRCILLSLKPTAQPVTAGKASLHQLLLKIDTTRKTSDTKALRVPQHAKQPTDLTIADCFITTLRTLCPTLPLVTPQPETFKPATTTSSSIGCYHGTSDGQLYPLSTGLLFLQRPVVWVGLEEVDGIEVRRSGGGKTFDLTVGVKRSGEKDAVVVFGMMSVMEQQAVEYYVQYVAKWQKKRDREQKTSAAPQAATAGGDSAANNTATKQTSTSAERSTPGDGQQDDSEDDSDADSDFNPDGSSDEEGDGGHTGGGSDSDDSGGGSGSDSDSDDSQYNSDIDLDAEVSADEEMVNERHRRRRAAQPADTTHTQPTKQHNRLNTKQRREDEASENDGQQPAEEAAEGAGQALDDDMSTGDSDAEANVESGTGDMSHFRAVAAADPRKSELASSASSTDDDEVITLG